LGLVWSKMDSSDAEPGKGGYRNGATAPAGAADAARLHTPLRATVPPPSSNNILSSRSRERRGIVVFAAMA
jgi:hypothetical protein